jgi:hypothetical protein
MIEDKDAVDGQDKRSFWTKVGVAFENKDGSFTIQLAAVPISGRLNMRDPKPAEAGEAAA